MENNSSYKLSEKTGIHNVIWIDDNFSSIHSNATERDSIIERIIFQIQDILESGNIDIVDSINEFQGCDWERPYPVIFQEIRDTLTSSEVNHSVILNQLCDETELNSSQLGIIKNTLESHFSLKTISLKDWLENKDSLIESKKDTVFLIDRQFTNEGGTDDAGEEIIQEILNKNRNKDDSPVCILFTQTCRDINEEEHSRKEIYKKLKDSISNLQSYKFQVLSKSRIADEDYSGANLINALKILLVRRTFTKMAYGLKERIEINLNDLFDKLINSNIYELEGVIFDSANKEGVSELELLDRIYQLNQRKVLSDLIVSQPEIISDIVLLREIKGLDTVKKTHNYSYLDFIEMRKSEYWTYSQSLNSINSQVSNGDIFDVNGKEYIFIGQPCEIILRKDGTRKCNVGILAPISQKSKSSMKSKSNLLSSGVCYSFQEHSKDDNQWLIEFNNSIYVDIGVLDYCSFNTDGVVRFCSTDKKPSILSIGGLGERFDFYKKYLLESPYKLPMKMKLEPFNISFNKDSDLPDEDDAFCIKPNDDNTIFNSEIKRVRRLENPYSEFVMNKYFLYKSRKAFDHDFTSF